MIHASTHTDAAALAHAAMRTSMASRVSASAESPLPGEMR